MSPEIKIIVNLITVVFAFLLVKLLQWIIDKLVKKNEEGSKRVRQGLSNLYSKYEEEYNITKAPMNILRGITIQMSLKEEKDKMEFVEDCKILKEKEKSSSFLFIFSRIGKIALHSIAILTLVLTLDAFRVSWFWIPMILFAIIFSLINKSGAVRYVFNIALFAYLGYFLLYTIIFYILILRIDIIISTIKRQKYKIK